MGSCWSGRRASPRSEQSDNRSATTLGNSSPPCSQEVVEIETPVPAPESVRPPPPPTDSLVLPLTFSFSLPPPLPPPPDPSSAQSTDPVLDHAIPHGRKVPQLNFNSAPETRHRRKMINNHQVEENLSFTFPDPPSQSTPELRRKTDAKSMQKSGKKEPEERVPRLSKIPERSEKSLKKPDFKSKASSSALSASGATTPGAKKKSKLETKSRLEDGARA